MKKLTLIALAVMLCSTAFAQVKVSQNGILTTRERDAAITISGRNAAEILYDGVVISIPQGRKVVVSKTKQGRILISGANLEGVKVEGKALDYEEGASYIVDPKTKKVFKVFPNRPLYNPAPAQTEKVEDIEEEADQYVNPTASSQAVQDVEGQLSQSSATNI